MGMSIEEAIERYESNAEYERTHGNLQGCLEFRQLVEWLRKYQLMQAVYENRLKADMVALLTEIQVGIGEHINPSNHTDSYEDGWSEGAEWGIDYIQEIINELKPESENKE